MRFGKYPPPPEVAVFVDRQIDIRQYAFRLDSEKRLSRNSSKHLKPSRRQYCFAQTATRGAGQSGIHLVQFLGFGSKPLRAC
jgi:hypothetical protein